MTELSRKPQLSSLEAIQRRKTFESKRIGYQEISQELIICLSLTNQFLIKFLRKLISPSFSHYN